ncbi:mediator of RNA polymerase II transcription subunit 23 [Dorcoceras hygrometricum]|uniref:Mediator of RNA polymerase II transcription subunit 23 n=1 Tax=Dorcoceras hygrometricum TaxID=472368 RepID=A0A2Z7CNA7_9LAMI|nr:mediator of RNA polymerase II transcription subunit 23 [Dorcoceras hygrometricum]
MSLFDLQDVCIVIGSLATLDLPMIVDLIVIYGLKGPYCTLTTIDWFLQALSVIPRGSWGDVARRFTMIRWASHTAGRGGNAAGGAPGGEHAEPLGSLALNGSGDDPVDEYIPSDVGIRVVVLVGYLPAAWSSEVALRVCDDKLARSWLDRDLTCGRTVSHAVGGLPDSGASFVRCGARLGQWLVLWDRLDLGVVQPAGLRPWWPEQGGRCVFMAAGRDGVEVNIAWE